MTRPVWCLQIVKLSDAVQPLPRQTTQFVHGVPESFLAVGQAKGKPLEDGKPRFTRGAYFMGKVNTAGGVQKSACAGGADRLGHDMMRVCVSLMSLGARRRCCGRRGTRSWWS